MIHKIDKQRATYYDYYAGRPWGVASSYDICLNSSLFGINETANIIINILKNKQF
jgi:hypothetical protein